MNDFCPKYLKEGCDQFEDAECTDLKYNNCPLYQAEIKMLVDLSLELDDSKKELKRVERRWE